MRRLRSGSILKDKRTGHFYARVRYVDPSTGKLRSVKRYGPTKSAAIDERDKLLRDLERSGNRALEHERSTFREFATWYSAKYVKPAEYHQDRKVAGLRSWKSVRAHVAKLVDIFGDRRIRTIGYSDLEELKAFLLREPIITTRKTPAGVVETTRERTITNVNRTIETLRRMLNIARREKWILSNPFEDGDPVISKADETKRARVLSFDEEEQLLAQCVETRAHLRAIVIHAIDTGMRLNEILSLVPADVDLEANEIRIRAFTTKTATARRVPISMRLKQELEQLLDANDGAGTLYGVRWIQRSFRTACRLAGIEDLHFHDLRHTFTTRLVEAGMTIEQIMPIVGHDDPEMTVRYSNATEFAMKKAAEVMNAARAEQRGSSVN